MPHHFVGSTLAWRKLTSSRPMCKYPMVVGMQSVAPQIARRINDRAALDLLLTNGVMTRSGMRAALGMSQPSTLELFDRLLAHDLIEESGTLAGRRGPSATAYRVNTRKAMVVVARVGPLETIAAVADLSGELVSTSVGKAPEPGTNPAGLVAKTVRKAIEAGGVDDDTVQLAVVASAGVVDPETGDVSYVEGHPEWRGALRMNIEAELGMPVVLENQVKLLGHAELAASHNHGPKDFVVVSIGPAGIAAAVVLDGQLWRGANGAAGEIAYLPSGTSFPTLGPDNTVAGGLREELRALQAGGSADHTQLVETLSIGLGAICSVTDPSCVYLAGPWGREGGAALADAVNASLRSRWPMDVEVLPSQVSGDAVLKGAARAGLDRVLLDLWGPQTRLTTKDK